jgi:hypothetical protein
VERPLGLSGRLACKMLHDHFNGIQQERRVILNMSARFTESCGCVPEETVDISDFKKSVSNVVDGCRSDIALLNRITSKLAESESAEESMSVISKFIEKLECERFCLCLCSEWNNVYAGRMPDDYQIYGYTKTMSAPLIWTNGELSAVDSFQSADMFPLLSEGGGHVNYFFPLHFRERCLGYYIITDSVFPINSMLCHSILMNISNSIISEYIQLMTCKSYVDQSIYRAISEQYLKT